jgi:hypothetical protein
MSDSIREVERQLPDPDVSQEKKFFSNASITLPEKAMQVEIVVTERRIAEITGINLDTVKAEEFNQYKKFYLEAKGLMRALRPHITLEDKVEFEKAWSILDDILRKDLHNIASVEELTEFILRALNSSNLSELGVKSHIDEILSEIDISEI